MRIACIHAHPDDAEILAGGTLALLANLGHELDIVSLSCGDCGSFAYGPEELAAIRKKEAAEAAALIGARYRWGGFYDLSIFNDDASRRRVTGLLRDLNCEIVLTASPSDYLGDHEATSVLVREACFAASVPNYQTPSTAKPLSAIPALYFVDPIDQRDREGQTVRPDFSVNVGSVFSIKREMLAKHESQRAWLRQQHGMDDYLEQMEEWTRRCGARAGVELAEGFRQYVNHPYPQAPVLQEALRTFLAQ